MKRLTKFVALIIAMALFLCSLTACDPNAEKIDWENIKLGNILPEPQSNLMEVFSNDNERLKVDIHKISENEYFEYQRWCEEKKGFNIEIKSYGSSFNAYNKEGYFLSLSYYDSMDEMHISLDAPIPMEEFNLPEYAITTGLPVPDSKIGYYKWQNSDSFLLFVGDTTKEKYMSYRDLCIKAGFTDNPYEFDTVYSATNIEGYKVSLNYEGFNIFSIEFRSPENINIDINENETTESDIETNDNTDIEKPNSVFYSTNDYETAKNGNTGVFSYKNEGGAYDIYWIIDFDTGYVFWFTDGNGETTCDKVKIVDGNLNDRITITWNDASAQWSWYLHFKYKNFPETLVVNDHNGFATEFTTTNLADALKIRDTKTIYEY